MSSSDTYDVIVCGAGASGLTAALAAAVEGASVLVVEKSDLVGGTAAVSGGVVWAPGNPRMAEAGQPDTRQAALAYYRSLAGSDLSDETIETFIDQCGPAIRFIERHSPVRFAMIAGYPDYYLDRPGAIRDGGRALDSGLFAFTELGAWRHRVATNGAPLPLELRETPLGGGTGIIDPAIMAERLARDQRGFGQALVGGLLKACLDRGIEIRVSSPAKSLIEDAGRIAGLIVGSPDGDARLLARRGVILCTGGFESDPVLSRAFLRGPLDAPASPPTNHGDGLRLAMRAGASLGHMTKAWWIPVIAPPGDRWFGDVQQAHPVLFERTFPHSIMVNRTGRRFCNEAVSYVSLVAALHQRDPSTEDYPNLPAWLIFDETYKSRYPIAGRPPGPETPEWIVRQESLGALADAIGVDRDGLDTTVTRFNDAARTGSDPDYRRGGSDYEQFYGDRSRPGALATLGPIETAPFYALRIQVGVLGTCGGPVTDGMGRVLTHTGETIPGLYAAGNVTASPVAGIYAGAGGTLGPALTFGYLAGRHAALGAN